MHTYPLSVLRRQMRDSRSPADLRHIERGTWHENAFVTRAEPPYRDLHATVPTPVHRSDEADRDIMWPIPRSLPKMLWLFGHGCNLWCGIGRDARPDVAYLALLVPS
jgi:hypothetical protein